MQIFTLLMLIVAVLATAFIVGSVRSYWRKLRAGPHVASSDVGQSWYRPLVRG